MRLRVSPIACSWPLVLVACLLAGSAVLPACTSEPSSGTPSDTTRAATDSTSQLGTLSTDAAGSEPDQRDEAAPLAQKLDDARLEARVEQALMGTSTLRVFNFRIDATGGRVTLSGDVNTFEQYEETARTARGVDGVSAVTSQITVDGRPVTEERLENASAEEGATQGGDGVDEVYHTVRRGETLWDIAQQYSASVRRIRDLNDLSAATLRPGQRIRVR